MHRAAKVRILAKSLPRGCTLQDAPRAVFLQGHLRYAHQAGNHLLDTTGRSQLGAFGLDPEAWIERFRRSVAMSCAIHDLGKANDHFQGMIQPDMFPERRGRPQGLRHEWATLLIAQDEKVHDWLKGGVQDDRELLAALWAITGHHPAHNRPSPPREPAGRGEGAEMRLLLDQADVVESLAWLGDSLDLGNPPRLEQRVIPLVGSTSVFPEILGSHIRAAGEWQRMDAGWRRFVAAVKACVIAADVAGSALPRTRRGARGMGVWIEAAFTRNPDPDEISSLITEGLTDPYTGVVHELRPFQRAVGEVAGDVTFVKAGCGSGKTLAAYHWARTHCPGRRLYFCYPTTGTATEGFRDYLWDAGEHRSRAGADLFHGRASVDLEILCGAEEDEGRPQEASPSQDAFERIKSLDAWSTPIVSCTVDTVLGLLQNNRRGLYAWPALAGAAFIFDEVHAYDGQLFAAFLRFIEYLPCVPILVMTASLPGHRLDALRLSVHRRGSHLQVPKRTADLEELEELARYNKSDFDPHVPPFSLVQEEMLRGGKVLWVLNTVNRAMNAAAACRELGLTPLLYHSRFRYEDRVARHGEVVKMFREAGPVLAVTTQVAEMSLNLSASLLVTDLAPVPSLIQRLGRLNRRAQPGDPARHFVVSEPMTADGRPQPMPYNERDLEDARQWLADLPCRALSQADLVTSWEARQERSPEEQATAPFSTWLDGGPSTVVTNLREPSHGITVLMESDLSALKNKAKRLVQSLLPMPPPPSRSGWRGWPRYHGVPVTPPDLIDYDAHRGARWRRT